MAITLEKLVHHHARYRGNELAVVFGSERLSWSEFENRVNQLANALLNRGISKNDKVATALPNSMELLTIYWASVSIGAVIVPLSPLLKAGGLVNLLNNSDSRILFLTDKLKTELKDSLQQIKAIPKEIYITTGSATDTQSDGYSGFIKQSPVTSPPFPDMQQDDLFNIVYSSGTTGLPKGIMHSHLVRAQYGAHFAASFRMTPESIVLHTGSIIFNGAFVTLMPCFFLGATYILHSCFDVEAMIQTIQHEKVTHIMMVPAQIIAVLQSPNFKAENMQSLEMVLTLGAPLQQHYKKQFNDIVPGCFYELYGLTEGFVTILDKNDFNEQSGSVGCPPPGYEIRIVNEDNQNLGPDEIGEIVGRGPILASGYYKQPDLTHETIRDGWLYTGDMGYLDSKGFLYLSGRKKELIISGGVNVFPQDIEDIATAHPDVLESAVFGIESDKWGETPIAAVILKNNTKVGSSELRDWINARVEARYQKVSDVFIVKEMPRNVAGKTVKNKLREIYCGH